MFSRQIKVNIDMTWHHVIGQRRERALSAKDLRRFGSEKCRRKVSLLPVLVEVLRHHVNSRISGPVFLRRCFQPRSTTWGSSQSSLERELERRLADQEAKTSMAVERVDRL